MADLGSRDRSVGQKMSALSVCILNLKHFEDNLTVGKAYFFNVSSYFDLKVTNEV